MATIGPETQRLARELVELRRGQDLRVGAAAARAYRLPV